MRCIMSERSFRSGSSSGSLVASYKTWDCLPILLLKKSNGLHRKASENSIVCSCVMFLDLLLDMSQTAIQEPKQIPSTYAV